MIRWGWLVSLWMVVIFAFSHQPGMVTNRESPLWYVVERKSAHVFEYALLTWLVFRWLRSRFGADTWLLVSLTACAWAVAYGALDEIHQSFVTGRSARMTDVLFDASGAVIALALLRFVHRYQNTPIYAKEK